MNLRNHRLMDKNRQRFQWAASVIEAVPSDAILEIGCGTGLLAGFLANNLVEGHITAIDRSSAMISKAKKNNEEHIRKGRMTIENHDFKVFRGSLFDKVVAFNVNFFLKDSPDEFRMLKKVLRGKLFCFYRFPYKVTRDAAFPIAQRLTANGFEIKDILFKDIEPTPAICIIAQTKTS